MALLASYDGFEISGCVIDYGIWEPVTLSSFVLFHKDKKDGKCFLLRFHQLCCMVLPSASELLDLTCF